MTNIIEYPASARVFSTDDELIFSAAEIRAFATEIGTAGESRGITPMSTVKSA